MRQKRERERESAGTFNDLWSAELVLLIRVLNSLKSKLLSYTLIRLSALTCHLEPRHSTSCSYYFSHSQNSLLCFRLLLTEINPSTCIALNSSNVLFGLRLVFQLEHSLSWSKSPAAVLHCDAGVTWEQYINCVFITHYFVIFRFKQISRVSCKL